MQRKNSKTQNMTYIQTVTKLENSNYDKTQIMTKLSQFVTKLEI